MKKKGLGQYLPMILGLCIGCGVAVLITTGKAKPLIANIKHFFDSSPTVGPWVWVVLGLILIGIYYYATNRTPKNK